MIIADDESWVIVSSEYGSLSSTNEMPCLNESQPIRNIFNEELGFCQTICISNKYSLARLILHQCQSPNILWSLKFIRSHKNTSRHFVTLSDAMLMVVKRGMWCELFMSFIIHEWSDVIDTDNPLTNTALQTNSQWCHILWFSLKLRSEIDKRYNFWENLFSDL